jgi:perosamine synthetase
MSINDRVRHESKELIFEDHIELGYNYRLTDIQAAIGIKQLEKLDWIINERKKLADIYNKSFKDVTFFRLQSSNSDYKTNYQSYCIYLKKDCPITRNMLMKGLLDAGISSRRGVMTTHRETAYLSVNANLKLRISEDLQDNSIILPLYVPMLINDIQYVIDTVLKLVSIQSFDASLLKDDEKMTRC